MAAISSQPNYVFHRQLVAGQNSGTRIAIFPFPPTKEH